MQVSRPNQPVSRLNDGDDDKLAQQQLIALKQPHYNRLDSETLLFVQTNVSYYLLNSNIFQQFI